MARKPVSPAMIGGGIGLVAIGIVIALFGSILLGIVLVACGVGMPLVVRSAE